MSVAVGPRMTVLAMLLIGQTFMSRAAEAPTERLIKIGALTDS